MKKAYKKPGLFLESFEMAEHIARCGINHSDNGWGFKANHYADACKFSIMDGDMTFFVSASCNDDNGIVVDGETFEFGDLCYQGNQGADATVFFS